MTRLSSFVPAAKPDDLSLTSGTHMGSRDLRLSKPTSDLCLCAHVCHLLIPITTNNNNNKNKTREQYEKTESSPVKLPCSQSLTSLLFIIIQHLKSVFSLPFHLLLKSKEFCNHYSQS